MNLFDWKRIQVFIVILCGALLITVWAYYFFLYPLMSYIITSMLSSVLGGLMFYGYLFCWFQMKRICLFYEQEYNDGDDL